MLCPKCNKEMKSGFIQTTASGGICWVKNKHTIEPPVVDEEFQMLGKAHYIKPVCIPAFHCLDCKMVVGDYSDL